MLRSLLRGPLLNTLSKTDEINKALEGYSAGDRVDATERYRIS